MELAGAARETFGLAGRTMAVDADDASVAQVLAAGYEDARVAPVRTANHAAAVRRLPDGRLHVRFDRKPLNVGNGAAAVPLLSAYYATKEIFARFASAVPDALALYGGLIAMDGAAVLILGPTGIGKTLLTLHCAWQGASFLGDETAVIDFGSRTVSALARKPALREAALAHVQHAQIAASIASGKHVVQTDRGRLWYALEPDEIGGVRPSARPHSIGVVCLVRRQASGFGMRRIDLSEAMPAIVARAYARPSQLMQLAALRRVMRGVPIYEIALGDPRTSAATLLQGLRACA